MAADFITGSGPNWKSLRQLSKLGAETLADFRGELGAGWERRGYLGTARARPVWLREEGAQAHLGALTHGEGGDRGSAVAVDGEHDASLSRHENFRVQVRERLE